MARVPAASIRTAGVAGRAGYGTALLAYSVALPLLLLVPPGLKEQSPLASGFTWQEFIDLFTPVVLLPLFAVALARGGGLGREAVFALVVIGAVWVSGQAMHLAANAIGDEAVATGTTSYLESAPGLLGEWIDEVLSHWLWHVGWVALLLLLAWSTSPSRSIGDDSVEGANLAMVGGAIQGFTWFVVTVEGVTAALGIPAAIVYVGLGLVNRQAPGTARVTATFLVTTGVVALICYAAWATINGGALPELTEWVPPW